MDEYKQAIRFGMSYNEYWHGEPKLFWVYRDFYIEDMKEKHELMDREAWLHGLYVYQALTVSLNGIFSSKKSNNIKYPDSPNIIKLKDDLQHEEDEEQALKRAQREMANKIKMQHHNLSGVPKFNSVKT